MEAIVRAKLPAKVAAVISSRADGGSSPPRRALLPGCRDQEFSSREALTPLAGRSMRTRPTSSRSPASYAFGGDFVRGYSGRLVNIHPSLLPAFPGLHTHRRALQKA
jgi:phosphoribosylglycinamide formyltransferase-1